MALSFHHDETPPSSVHPIEFYATTDPVGNPNNNVAAGKQWLKTDNLATPTWFELYRRNTINTAWILMRAWTNTTLTEGDILVVNADGRLEPLTIGASGEALVSDGTTLAYTGVATQGQIDAAIAAAIAGLSWKGSVRVATTVAGTLATSFENGDTVDGVVLATGDRLLIKNQAAGAENGIYTVNASGAPTRAADADSAAAILQASVYVQEGTANADTQWVLTTNAPITLDSTTLTFTEFATGGGGTVDIEDEGSPEGAADTFDFVGAGVTASVAAGVATINIPGGGGGGGLIESLPYAHDLIAPVDGDFSWVNQGGASTDTSLGGVRLDIPSNSGNNYRQRVKAAPGTPYTITAYLDTEVVAQDHNGCGLLFRNSGAGTIVALELGFSTSWYIRTAKWTSPTAFSATYTSLPIAERPRWLRIADDGANRISSFSHDGVKWFQLHSVGRTDFLTADQVGWGGNVNNTTYSALTWLLSWAQS